MESCRSLEVVHDPKRSYSDIMNMVKKNKRSVTRNTRATGKLSVRKPKTDTLSKAMPLFPDRRRAYLTYHDSVSFFTGASGAVGNYIFAANGLYDPDVSGTGHQPMGFDQMMVFYYHYTVLKAKIKATFKNNSASLPAYVAVSRNGSSSPVTDMNQLVESGNVEYHFTNRSPDTGCFCTLTLDMDISKFEGVDDLMDDNTYRGDVAANPSDIAYFHLSAWNVTDSSSFTHTVDVVIEYEVMFTEPRKPTLSVVEPKETNERKTTK